MKELGEVVITGEDGGVIAAAGVWDWGEKGNSILKQYIIYFISYLENKKTTQVTNINKVDKLYTK